MTLIRLMGGPCICTSTSAAMWLTSSSTSMGNGTGLKRRGDFVPALCCAWVTQNTPMILTRVVLSDSHWSAFFLVHHEIQSLLQTCLAKSVLCATPLPPSNRLMYFMLLDSSVEKLNFASPISYQESLFR